MENRIKEDSIERLNRYRHFPYKNSHEHVPKSHVMTCHDM